MGVLASNLLGIVWKNCNDEIEYSSSKHKLACPEMGKMKIELIQNQKQKLTIFWPVTALPLGSAMVIFYMHF